MTSDDEYSAHQGGGGSTERETSEEQLILVQGRSGWTTRAYGHDEKRKGQSEMSRHKGREQTATTTRFEAKRRKGDHATPSLRERLLESTDGQRAMRSDVRDGARLEGLRVSLESRMERRIATVAGTAHASDIGGGILPGCLVK